MSDRANAGTATRSAARRGRHGASVAAAGARDTGSAAVGLKKGIHEASAHVRSIDGVGLELRFMIDGELRHSELFRDWRSLEQAAAEKKTDFLSRGWQ